MDYRYEHFTAGLLKEDASFTESGAPGTPMPDFNLPTVDGIRVTRDGYLERGRPLLVTFASVTCPMTASAGPALKQLYVEFSDRVEFLTVYVREAHPGDHYPQPRTLEQKLQHARDYRQRDRIPWPVAVDDFDGTLHRALDAKPNAAYVMTPDGRIARRVLWSNDARGVREAIEAVLEGRPRGQREAKMGAMMRGVGCMKPTLESAGPVALQDLRREVPPVYLLARTADMFRPLPPLGRCVAAAGTLLAWVAAVAFAVRAGARAVRGR